MPFSDAAVDFAFGDTPSISDMFIDPAVDWIFRKIHDITRLPENQSDPVDTLIDIFKRVIKETIDPDADLPDDSMKQENESQSQSVTPGDPNEKIGWSESGWPGITTATHALHYVVFFENDPRIATAPAQEVIIEDALDSNLDWSTFRLEEIAWGETTVPMPAETSSLNTRVTIPDYRTGGDKSWWVDVAVEVDATGTARWTFRTLDPSTGDWPEDALAGFLPVNNATGRGQGHVAFRIRPLGTTPAGSQLANRAVIRFDTEAPIETGLVLFTVSDRAPLLLQGIGVTGSEFRFALPTEAGVSYTVESIDDLGSTDWVHEQTIVGDGSVIPCVIPHSTNAHRFFRVRQP